KQEGTSVAVELARKSRRWRVVELTNTPRIFVAFPLTATRDFCLPVVMNNESLQPREDRDTIFLKENREGNPNLNVVEGACDLAARLAMLAAAKDWERGVALSRLGELRQSDWLDEVWLRSLLAERFVEPLRQAKIMPVAVGQRRPPIDGRI